MLLSVLPLVVLSGQPQQAGQTPKTLAERIGHYDIKRARESTKVHQGAGTLFMQTLLGRGAITGLNFMHIGPLMPKSSIGHHFHNDSDEMFLILDADCEFTVNGHTSLLPAPMGVPCKAGNSHAVYNPTDKPAAWVNFQIGKVTQGGGGMMMRTAYNYSADPIGLFDLYDDRVGVPLEKPSFLHTRQLTKDLMRPVPNMNGGKDTVFYRRALGPSAFETNWAFVDHILLPPGATVGKHLHNGVEEIYFVIKGKGSISVGDESADIIYGDAVPVRAGEAHSLTNNSAEPFELIIYGVALEKGKLDVTDVK
jgi:mannose-6-phosphate isomerase-like protein (cupin superfamily)